VQIQIRRQPREYSYGPWSIYVGVSGVATVPVLEWPSLAANVGSGEEQTHPLLSIVWVPVGVVLLL
jgi:hypothetical protein